jgi:putative intracellular protease/amidase
MSRSDDHIFVFWGNGFDEATAAIFVTELRRIGLRVKVVGLTQRRSNGACGLALVPDLTLEQALSLANRTTCLVVPYTSSGRNRLGNDPRLKEFFQQAHANDAKFVIGQLDQESLDLFPPTIDKVIVDLGSEELIKDARSLAWSLSTAM